MKFKTGQVVWRGYRYWANDQDFLRGALSGWNTCFVPYRIVTITNQRIEVRHDGNTMAHRQKSKKDWQPLFLNRATMETAGKQYHTRHHEYFYATKPKSDPEHQYRVQSHVPTPTKAMVALNLSPPFSKQDVYRAYRRLAFTAHPDTGGSHEAFIELQRARDAALRSL